MSKYSLRVELDRELELKLRRIAANRGLTLTDVVRQELATVPEVKSFSVDETIDRFPKLHSKLCFWARKRLSGARAYSGLISYQDAVDDVAAYLMDFLGSSSDSGLRQAFEKWDRVLTRQEKTAIGSFFPFMLPSEWKGEWFSDSDWYNFQNGEYIILKEEVLDGVSHKNEDVGIVSINQYEAKVLNAHYMPIVDVDLKGNDILPTDPVVTKYESVALAALEAFQADNPELGFRVYRTAAGLRYICTTKEMLPNEHASDRMMKHLLADPKYRNLCRFQETYRARLTPKPWRMDWSGEFEDYRVCELIKIVGDDRILPSFEKMVRYHDAMTNAEGEDREFA